VSSVLAEAADMVSPVLLNNVEHGDVRIRTGHGAQYGDAINIVRVFVPEFEDLQREYPILLRRKGGEPFHAVALLGLDRDENLFLAGGEWNGRYVPALLERGPFSIGVRGPTGTASSEPMIHIDLDHARITREDGHRLFLPQGGNAPYLDHIRGVLTSIFNGVEIEKTIFAAFEEHGLIVPINIEVKLNDERQYNLADFRTISVERLMRLDGAALESLHRDDYFRAAVWLTSSLRNISRLIDLKNGQGG
jgi:hypothetical protein